MKNLKTIASKELHDYKVLLRNVPSLVVVAFVMSAVLMNLMANKIIWQHGPYLAADGGILLSWLVFLVMDVTTKHFGARAAIKLNVLAVIINIMCVLLFSFIAWLPGNGEDFSAFNSVFSSTWFVVLGSTVAFLVSGIVNAVLNHLVGKLFIKNPNTQFAFLCRSYVSTFFAQWIDNFIFSAIVFVIFAPIYWGFGYTIWLAIGSGALGAVIELLVEVVFGPLGYKIVTRWQEEDIGSEYIELHKEEII